MIGPYQLKYLLPRRKKTRLSRMAVIHSPHAGLATRNQEALSSHVLLTEASRSVWLSFPNGLWHERDPWSHIPRQNPVAHRSECHLSRSRYLHAERTVLIHLQLPASGPSWTLTIAIVAAHKIDHTYWQSWWLPRVKRCCFWKRIGCDESN